MFIESHHDFGGEKSESAISQAEKGRFPREIEPRREIGFFDPANFRGKRYASRKQQFEKTAKTPGKRAFSRRCRKGRSEAKERNRD
jgi:hypothetical protein